MKTIGCSKYQLVLKLLNTEFKDKVKPGTQFTIAGCIYEIFSIDMNSVHFEANDGICAEPDIYQLICFYDCKCDSIPFSKPTINGNFEFYNKSDGHKYKASFIVDDYDVNTIDEKITFNKVFFLSCQSL